MALPSVYLSLHFILAALTPFSRWLTYLHSITVRQTRNHLATDVEYIASKTITLPDPRRKVRSTILSKLGFGTRTQKFFVRYIPLFSSPPQASTLSKQTYLLYHRPFSLGVQLLRDGNHENSH